MNDSAMRTTRPDTPPRLLVGILDPLGSHGGFHYYTEGLANGLSDAGCQVTLYGLDAPLASKRPRFAWFPAFNRLYDRSSKMARAIRFAQGLARALRHARRERTEIIHLHCFHYDLREIASAALVRALGMRLAVTLHDIDSFGKRNGALGRQLILGLSNLLFVHNAFSARQLKDNAAQPINNIHIVPHGHYLEYYGAEIGREQARSQLNLDVDRPVILFFGNPRKEKGLDILLSALRQPSPPQPYLLVAGKMRDDTAEHLRAMAEGELRGQLRIDAGHVSDADAELYFRACDAVVLPYRRIYESGVALMAMSFGRPIIHSDLEPLLEAIGAGGWSFESGNPSALASALRSALADPEELERRGDIGKSRILENRSWTSIGAATASAYASSLSSLR